MLKQKRRHLQQIPKLMLSTRIYLATKATKTAALINDHEEPFLTLCNTIKEAEKKVDESIDEIVERFWVCSHWVRHALHP